MEQIFDIILNNYHTSMFTKDEINKIVFILSEENNVLNYVKNVRYVKINQNEVNHKSNKCFIAYDLETKEIIIDSELMIEYVNKLINSDLYNNLNEIEKKLFVKMHILNALCHEIEHAKQNKKTRSINTRFDNVLFGECLRVINTNLTNRITIKKRNNYCNNLCKYDNASPEERIANIRSIDYVLKLLNEIRPYVPNLIESFEKKKNKILLKGYDFNDKYPYPSYRYISDLVDVGVLSIPQLIFISHFLKKSKNLSLQKRLTYGIDITPDEYLFVKRKIK